MEDTAFWNAIARRYQGCPAWLMPSLAELATSPAMEPERRRISAAVSLLDGTSQDRALTRLADEAEHHQVVSELTVLSVLHSAGVQPCYEPEVDGLTPDIWVPGAGPHAPVILEVWTRSVPKARRGELTAWRDLGKRLRHVGVPVIVAPSVRGRGQLRAPDAGEAKRLAKDLAAWLLSPTVDVGASKQILDYTFHVVGQAPAGLATRLRVPALGGSTSTRDILEVLKKKAHRYAGLARNHGAALIIVLAGERASSMSRSMLESALKGEQAFSHSFDWFQGGQIADSQTYLSESGGVPALHPDLCAVAWLEPSRPGAVPLHLYDVPSPRRLVPDAVRAACTVVPPLTAPPALRQSD